MFFAFLLLPASAENNSIPNPVNITNKTPSDYILAANNKTQSTINVLNVSAEDVLEFRILDNTSKKFITEGRIKLDRENKALEIKSDSTTEVVKDVLKGLFSMFFGGESTAGNNSEYYAKYPLVETTENYYVKATGEYIEPSGMVVQTVNTLTIGVETKYITQTAGNLGRNYESISMKNLNNQVLKFHKEKHSQYITKLKQNVSEFLETSHDLNNKINNITSSPSETELKSLPVDKVLNSQIKVEDSINEFKVAAEKDNLVGKKLKEQLDSIRGDSGKIIIELTNSLSKKKDNLLKKELENAEALENSKTKELDIAKSNFRNEIFIPAGALILLGLITGYFNVNRWKKESEYFGLYTSKANITSPITIAIILTIVILLLIGAVIYSYGDFGMLKFLI